MVARPAGSPSFRPIDESDLPFLFRLYASTRSDEMAVTGWSREEIEAFLRMQFEAQHRFYQAQFPAADYDIVLISGAAAGRLYVDRRADEFRLIDIALLPEFRNQGLGRGLIEDLLREAGAAGQPVRIHVEQRNPAMRLYRRLGFAALEENGIYRLMEWTP